MAGNDAHGGNLRQRGEITSQPFNEPSMIGRCFTKTRSPANSVFVVVSRTVRSQSVCAGGQACKFESPSAEIERHAIGDESRLAE